MFGEANGKRKAPKPKRGRHLTETQINRAYISLAMVLRFGKVEWLSSTHYVKRFGRWVLDKSREGYTLTHRDLNGKTSYVFPYSMNLATMIAQNF